MALIDDGGPALDPCPFCGGSASLDTKSQPHCCRVVCWNCGAASGYVSVSHGGSPVAAWNRRVVPAARAESVKAFLWVRNAEKDCSYDNSAADTPFGRYFITWKSWKDYPSFTVDEAPGEFVYTGGSLEETQAACAADFARKWQQSALIGALGGGSMR